MEGNSNQNGSSSSVNLENNSIEFGAPLTEDVYNNCILLELEKGGYILPDKKAEELIKNLTKLEYLFALKLLFENPFNQFSDDVLRNSLIALADPSSFDFYGKQSVARLELHIRVWVAVLEKICFAPIRLSKELRDKVYNSLAKFAEIHNKTTQVMQEGIDNNYRFNELNQSQDNMEHGNERNYNIDFLLIHLRDTLHSLRDDETWFQEIIRRTKELLKAVLNITPGVLSTVAPGVPLPNDNCSILSMLTQLRKGLNFKYPVASYYIDWRIMLIIQHNLFNWSGSVSKKFQEMVLMEYFWSYLEKEWIDVADKSILDSQSKFDEVSNKLIKVLRNTGNFINDLAGNEPLALPHTLWFGILDLAQNLVQKSTRKSTHGLCYYLAIESLKRAPSSFIQFKATEMLIHLQSINNQIISLIEIDFDQYIQKLNENNSTTDSSEKFQNLLSSVKKKCSNDFNLLVNKIEKSEGKGKGREKSLAIQTKEILNSGDILEIIANDITCPVGLEPTDKLYVLKCQHILSFRNLKKLKQKNCPECREKIEDNEIKYLPLNTIYKNLYPQFFDAGHILPSIELEDSTNTNQYDSDSGDSEVDLILSKKKKILKAIKLNSNISLKSIFQIGKKQHPTYLSAIKELEKKNYKKAEYWCKEFLKTFPKSYSMRCILAYTYRCLNNYDQAHFYLNEAIKLKEKKPNAWYIRGEIHLRQGNYNYAAKDLISSINYNAKINNLHMMVGISHQKNFEDALKNFKIALQNDPNNYLCLKYCAYVYEKQEKNSHALEMLDKLINLNDKDSLILCYYGEILSNMKKYNDAMKYFTKAAIIDPENVHNLIKRAFIYYILQEYDKALLDLNKAIQLDSSNNLAHFYKGLIYQKMKDIKNSMEAFEKSITVDSSNILTHFYKGLIYQKKGDIKSSMEAFEKIITLDPNNNSYNIPDCVNLIIKCKINIELKKYEEAELYLNKLFKLNDYILIISLVRLLQKYSDFWSYMCKLYDFHGSTYDGAISGFDIYMYRKYRVYFISNATNVMNLKNNYQILECSNLNRCALTFEKKLRLPILYIRNDVCDAIWKINIKKIISSNCFIKFIADEHASCTNRILKYEEILKLKGLGWIEYAPFHHMELKYNSIQLLIEKDFIDMEVEYVRFTNIQPEKQIYFPEMDYLCTNNVPEVFEDNYFSRKEVENLLELKDIINNL